MELLDTTRAAELCGVAPATLRYWRHRGIGPKGFTVGRKAVRYRREDVETWLQAQYEATELGA